jgi:hypothetical protein
MVPHLPFCGRTEVPCVLVQPPPDGEWGWLDLASLEEILSSQGYISGSTGTGMRINMTRKTGGIVFGQQWQRWRNISGRRRQIHITQSYFLDLPGFILVRITHSLHQREGEVHSQAKLNLPSFVLRTTDSLHHLQVRFIRRPTNIFTIFALFLLIFAGGRTIRLPYL